MTLVLSSGVRVPVILKNLDYGHPARILMSGAPTREDGEVVDL